MGAGTDALRQAEFCNRPAGYVCGIKDQRRRGVIVHVGHDPQLPSDPTAAVYAPFTPDSLPEGFELVQELVFGRDVSMRLRKTG